MTINTVTYTVALTQENASKIDQINQILISTVPASDKPAPVKQAPAEQKEVVKEPETGFTIEDLKTAAKASKKDHGDEFTMQAMSGLGVNVAATLGRSMSAVPVDLYEEVIAAWEAGPQSTPVEDEDDLELEDDDGLGDDVPTVDAEAVKTALRAYSKSTGRDEAKAIMAKFNVKSLGGVDDMSPSDLGKMFKALV